MWDHMLEHVVSYNHMLEHTIQSYVTYDTIESYVTTIERLNMRYHMWNYRIIEHHTIIWIFELSSTYDFQKYIRHPKNVPMFMFGDQNSRT